MNKAITKRSPKADKYGLKVQYRVDSQGHCDLWVIDPAGLVAYERRLPTPEAAFGHFYRWLRDYAEANQANNTSPSPPPVEGDDIASLILAIGKLVMRLDALLDRADAIFSHADKVLQELT
jgi:hypothetical protein